MKREKQEWMKLSQEEINELTEEGWEHYQDGGCLCYAHGEDECACGAWEFWEQSE